MAQTISLMQQSRSVIWGRGDAPRAPFGCACTTAVMQQRSSAIAVQHCWRRRIRCN